MFSYHFDVLMSKINFLKLKNIILMCFEMKIFLKNNNYYTFKHTRNVGIEIIITFLNFFN